VSISFPASLLPSQALSLPGPGRPAQAGEAALILADGQSPDLAPLLAGAREPLLTLPPHQHPLAAIGAALLRARLAGTAVATLHLVAHGRPGALRFGNQWITTASLVAAASELAAWKVEQIALWSCHAAADPAFTATLAELTGARVLASTTVIDSVGHQSIAAAGGETLQLSGLFAKDAIAAWGGSLLNEYTLTNQQLNFAFDAATLYSGGYDASTGRLLDGTAYRYNNVVTIDGRAIDAIVSINSDQAGKRAFISNSLNFDSNDFQYSANLPVTDPSYDPSARAYFQPNIQIRSTSGTPSVNLDQYVSYNIRFYEHNSLDPALLKNLAIDVFDIDGNGATQTARQFVEFDTVGTYVLAADTKLVVINGIGGDGIRFAASPTDGTNYLEKPGTPVGDSVRSQVRYAEGVSSLSFKLGDYSYNSFLGGYTALFALNFGAPNFSGPTQEFGLKASSVVVAECGNQAQLTVSLVAPKAPTADVTVDLCDALNRTTAFGALPNVEPNGDGSFTVNKEFTVSKAQLVFTTANWNTPQSITVTGLNDTLIDGNFIFNALLRATSTDPCFNKLSTCITIKNLDNDTLITAPTVSIGDGYSTFAITAAADRTLLLSAVDGSTSGIAAASIETSADGSTWSAYNGTSGFKVPGSGAVTFLARVSLAPLGQFDGTNTFKLVVASPDVPCPTEATATVVGLSSLGDRVWLDANGNGQQDGGEAGLAGVTVELYASVNGLPSGAALATTTTDGSGSYQFSNLQAGAYIARFLTPGGYLPTAANIGADTSDSDAGSGGYSGTYNLAAGTKDTTVDAGFYQGASIAGSVFADSNDNGIRDNGEAGIGGVKITITGTDGAGNAVSRSATTATDGSYSFTDLAPGTYTVAEETQPVGYLDGQDSAGNSGGTVGPDRVSGISLASGTTATNVNFGELLPASIGDRLWVDTNGDGIQNDGATGLAGRTVTLISGGADRLLSTLADNTTSTTTTGADGIYGFANLTPGEYQVVFGDKPAGTVFTSADAGVDDALDSDVNASGQSGLITLVAGQANTSVDAGIFTPASLGDRVWNDANGNGQQDTGELGIANVAVALFKADGTTQVGSTTTDSAGLYSFANLNPGTYRVKVTNPTGFNATTKGTNATSGTDSNVDALGFTDVITLQSGDANTTIDAGYTVAGGSLPGGGGDLQITKSNGLTRVNAGQRITYTIEVKNVGNNAVANAVVSDVMPANLTNVTWTSAVIAGTVSGNDASGTGNISDTITSLGANSIVRYTVNATVLKPGTYPTATTTNFNFRAPTISSTTGTAGNSRTFSSDGVTLTARAFSREQVNCKSVSWTNAFLGNYTSGLGVTNGAESGTNYRIDNVGSRKDYLLLQFSESVVLDKAYLKSVLTDSDARFWIGTAAANLTSLSDATLAALGYVEQNNGGGSDRTADVNARNLTGNTVVIAAGSSDDDSSCGNDNFIIGGLDAFKLVTSSSTLANTATVAGPIGFTDSNLANNSATDTDTIITAPGCRTPGFYVNKSWQTFWDGIRGNEPSQSGTTNFPAGNLFFGPYSTSQVGAVKDSVTGTYQNGVLVGDWNLNGVTDNGEETIFYTTGEALRVMDSSQQPDKGDVRYSLARSLVCSWLNYMAGNPVDTASTTDKDARVWINQGITWLQTCTPDENKDGKGDGMLSNLGGCASPSMNALDRRWWNFSTGGSLINASLDDYNNGRGLADGSCYGGA
jgi:uncharacterized repeat protein (TIGR01451 family)